eukprot:363464-Chlamydomonas_euryale.AAC.7
MGYVKVARYARTWGPQHKVRTNTQYVPYRAPQYSTYCTQYSTYCERTSEALRLPPVVLRIPQYRIRPARCGFHTMDRAPPQQVCATVYKHYCVGLFEHGADVHTCKKVFPRPS